MEPGLRLSLRRVICALPALGLAWALTCAAWVPGDGASFDYRLAPALDEATIVDDRSPLAGTVDGKEADAAAEERAAGTDELGYVPGEIVVVYEEDASEAERKEAAASLGAEEPDEASAAEGDVAALAIPDDMTVEMAVREAREAEAVKYAIPNYVAELAGEWDADPAGFISNPGALTEQGGDQWHLNFLNAPQAWALLDGYGGSIEPVKVAVIDTGASLTHPDLANVINRNQSVEVTWTDSKDSSSWKTAPLRGDGYTNGSAKPTEFTSHGTHVSGIIAGEAGNGGVLGVASGGTTALSNQLVDLVVIDAFSILNDKGQPNATLRDIVFAMEYARDAGCSVVNMSLGFASNDPELAQFFDEFCLDLTEQDDVLIICAAGNEHRQSPKNYPAACPSTMGVVSISDREGVGSSSATFLNPAWSGSNVLRSYFSNYGDWCDISAPGEKILSTYLQNGAVDGYLTMDGTSMACPMVSAAAALVRAADPDLTAEEVKSLLCETSADLYTTGRDVQTGYGALNAEAAVRRALDQRDGDEEVAGPVSVAAANVSAASATYNGRAQTPRVTVKLEGKTLVEGRDYQVSCPDGAMVDAGRYTVVVRGRGEYSGTAKAQFTISTAKMSSVQVSVPEQTFTGKELRPEPKVTWGGLTLVKGEDYTAYYQNNIVVGTGKVTLMGRDNFSGQTTATFTIKQAPAPTPATPTPAPAKPKPTPAPTTPKTPAAPQTPAPTTPQPSSPSTAKPTVKKVAAPKLKAGKRSFTVSWKKVSGNVSGYQVQYALDKKFKKSAKVKTLAKSKKSWKATKLKAKKRYYVRVRAYYKLDGKKYYGKWSTVKSVKTKR